MHLTMNGENAMMSLRPTPQTLESLRLTLQSLEHSADPSSNPQELEELKGILLKRIADLEVLDALSSQSSASPVSGEQSDTAPADLPPLEIVAAEEPAAEAVNTTQLDKKLD